MLETIQIKTRARSEMVDITARVREVVGRAGLQDGLVCIYSPHTTCGVTIQENDDPDVKTDMVGHLTRLVPQDPRFKHAEGNADAHIKTSLVGVSATVILDGGRLLLGRWQAIFLCEFDGPRDRTVHVKVLDGSGNRTRLSDV